jgi:hypothetical protein
MEDDNIWRDMAYAYWKHMKGYQETIKSMKFWLTDSESTAEERLSQMKKLFEDHEKRK